MLKTIYPRYPRKHGMSWCALAESRSFAKNRSRHLVLPIKLTDSHKERHLSWDHPQGWLEYLFQSRLWWLLVVSLWLVVAVGGWRCVRVDSQRRLPTTPFQKLRQSRNAPPTEDSHLQISSQESVHEAIFHERIVEYQSMDDGAAQALPRALQIQEKA